MAFHIQQPVLELICCAVFPRPEFPRPDHAAQLRQTADCLSASNRILNVVHSGRARNMQHSPCGIGQSAVKLL
jgi:hypothetical protein